MADTGISFLCGICISVLQRVFRTCPTFGSHWAVTRLRNLIKSGINISKHFVFMLIIFQVDTQSVSIRFLVFEKKIPLLLNRSVYAFGERFEYGIFCSIWIRGIHRSPVDYNPKGRWRAALMLSLICAWTNSWANNRDAGDLRRHRAHVTVMGYPHTPLTG